MTLTRHPQRRAASNWLLVYGAAITMAEIALVVSAPIGAVSHTVILIALASHTAFSRTPKDPQLPVVMLLPMIRLLSLVMPVDELDIGYVYLLSGVPTLIGVGMVVRAMELPLTAIGLGRPASIGMTGLVALTGVPIGLLLSSIVGSDLALATGTSPLIVVLAVFVTVALLEELIFRGLLQYVTSIRAPRLGLILPNVLYAAMYLSSANGPVVLGMGATGMLFSVFVARTGSLWGVVMAHIVMRMVIMVDAGI